MRKIYTLFLLFIGILGFGQPVIDAVVDSGSVSSSGGTAVFDVLWNDTISGLQIVPSQVTLSSISSTSPGVTLNGRSVVVTPGTAPGNYSLIYQICQTLFPTNCDTALVNVQVSNPLINAVDDTIIASGGTNNFYNVFTNDTLNGSPVGSNNVNVTTLSSSIAAVNAQGFLFFGTGVPPPLPGVYFITYQICEIANPNNCDTAQVTLFLNGCNIIPSITSITQPNCSTNTGTVNISNLPNTNWSIQLTHNGTNLLPINGSGTTTVLSNLAQGNYSYVVNEGNCSSLAQNFDISPIGGISVSMQGTYADFNNDGFTNVGDVINYQITVINNSCDSPITAISLENNILNINGGPLASLSANSSDSTTFSASYVLTQANINAATVTNSIIVHGTLNGNSILNDFIVTNSLSLSNGIKLNAFLDSNSNGIQDGTEQNVNIGNFSYQINSGIISNVTSSSGILYLYESNPSNNYSIGYTLHSSFASNYSVTPSSYSNLTVANGSGITIYNFAITALPFNDISVNIIPSNGPPRPGFTYNNIIQITNNGTLPIVSETLTFIHDPALIIISTVSGSVPILNGFTYNISNLLPNESIILYVYMLVPTIPSVSLGQLLTNSATVTAPSNDFFLSNNTSSLTQTIVGSYDPNDKQESHGGIIDFDNLTADEYLTYTIRFENTGTANAINIKVEDALDNQLDENTIRMVTASHDYVLERVGSNLTWKFNGINLPPSVPNTQIGHGYITFQIKPKASFTVSDIIPNFAEIYFDFNPAIITNTQTTLYVPILNNENFAFDNLNYYPNPVKNRLSISNTSIIDSVEISSILGQNMFSQKVNSLETEIDLTELLSGIYFVKVVSDGQEKTIKIIKE